MLIALISYYLWNIIGELWHFNPPNSIYISTKHSLGEICLKVDRVYQYLKSTKI